MLRHTLIHAVYKMEKEHKKYVLTIVTIDLKCTVVESWSQDRQTDRQTAVLLNTLLLGHNNTKQHQSAYIESIHETVAMNCFIAA